MKRLKEPYWIWVLTVGLDNSHSFHRNFRFMEVVSANDVLKVF